MRNVMMMNQSVKLIAEYIATGFVAAVLFICNALPVVLSIWNAVLTLAGIATRTIKPIDGLQVIMNKKDAEVEYEFLIQSNDDLAR